MRVLLSTIGSRGDVQPLIALALELRALGHQVRLVAPSDFAEWVATFAIPMVPIGPELRPLTASRQPGLPVRPSPEVMRQMAEASVATQFETLKEAAEGCDLVVAATALQIAARSIAELKRIPYVFVAYCPIVLPSPHHTQPPMPHTFDEMFGAALNAHRQALGLSRVTDVRSHIFTDHPWLAADPTLGPWPDPSDRAVFQTGAWIVPDTRPLPDDLEAFLDTGEKPVYFGFGSMRAPHDLGQTLVLAARASGRRAIVSRGWAELSVPETPDCITIDEVNQQALFKRVAAVVHHGGAGTTTVAALAGAPQVIVPQSYDQYYWADRVAQLEIGAAHAAGIPSLESLQIALEQALQLRTAATALSVAGRIRTDGALIAARRLADSDLRSQP